MIYEKFGADNAALLLIDHQVGTMGWVKSISFEEMKRNALMLAQAARILKLPVVLTSSMEEYAQGPLLSELESILPAEFSGRGQGDRTQETDHRGSYQRRVHGLSGA